MVGDLWIPLRVESFLGEQPRVPLRVFTSQRSSQHGDVHAARGGLAIGNELTGYIAKMNAEPGQAEQPDI